MIATSISRDITVANNINAHMSRCLIYMYSYINLFFFGGGSGGNRWWQDITWISKY